MHLYLFPVAKAHFCEFSPQMKHFCTLSRRITARISPIQYQPLHHVQPTALIGLSACYVPLMRPLSSKRKRAKPLRKPVSHKKSIAMRAVAARKIATIKKKKAERLVMKSIKQKMAESAKKVAARRKPDRITKAVVLVPMPRRPKKSKRKAAPAKKVTRKSKNKKAVNRKGSSKRKPTRSKKPAPVRKATPRRVKATAAAAPVTADRTVALVKAEPVESPVKTESEKLSIIPEKCGACCIRINELMKKYKRQLIGASVFSAGVVFAYFDLPWIR